MKNQKGFIGPLLLGIIALLVIGGGIYVYKIKKAEAPASLEVKVSQNGVPLNNGNNHFINSGLNQNTCESINNSTFNSVEKYVVGMGPNGPVKDSFRVIFKDGRFEWLEAEVGGGNGTYTCNGSDIQGKTDANVIVLGNYLSDEKILTWNGIKYQKTN